VRRPVMPMTSRGEAGDFPFDGTHTDFGPDAAWLVPPGWCRLAGAATPRPPGLIDHPSRYSHPSACHLKLAATSSRTLRPVLTCSNAR
jgi:hypothetical protein